MFIISWGKSFDIDERAIFLVRKRDNLERMCMTWQLT